MRRLMGWSIIHRLNTCMNACLRDRINVSPNTLTVIGMLLMCSTVWLLQSGFLFLSCWIILFSSLFDVLDGKIARLKNNGTQFGAFLDSVFDRYADSFILMGLLLYYYRTSPTSFAVIL